MSDVSPVGAFERPRLSWKGPIVALTAIAIIGGLRFFILENQTTRVAYSLGLITFVWVRERRWLWVTFLAFVVMASVETFFTNPIYHHRPRPNSPQGVLDLALIVFNLGVFTAAIHLVIGARDQLERRAKALALANKELAAREKEIAGQNDSLQTQAEKLESQAGELHASNGELAARERTLEMLLSLSRALGSDPSRDQATERICIGACQLLNGAAAGGARAAAAAILEQEGDSFIVRCWHGFGPGGPAETRLPVACTFASIVLGEGRSAYLTDLSLRPELAIPRPASDLPFASVLTAPLRMGGWPAGALEVYSREQVDWLPAQVALLESLAAQMSVSLEASRLFENVAAERRRLSAVLRAAPVGIAVANAGATDIRLNPAGAALFGVPPDTNVAADARTAPTDSFAAQANAASNDGAASRDGAASNDGAASRDGAASNDGAASHDPGDATVPANDSHWRLFQDGDPLPRDKYPLARGARGEEVRGLECGALLADGRRLTLLVHASPVRDAAGKPAGAVSSFTDITPQKELQRELDARRREAEEASVRKTRFLAAVSHDIRTPANSITLLAELVRRAASNPAMASEVPELARELHGSAKSLVNLLSDLLDVARFDADKIELHETEFSLPELLNDDANHMRPLAREKGLELLCAAPEPAVIRCDRVKLSRVLGNLLGNAIKFTETGEVRLSAALASEGGPMIRVADTGIGIEPENQRHIFDEFFQLRNPERDRNKGTGLGLTICKRLVDAMGGALTVESAVGRGSVFTVVLPTSCLVRA